MNTTTKSNWRASRRHLAEKPLLPDAVISFVAGRYGWCCGVHVTGDKFARLIESSLDADQFCALWNDFNNLECPNA